MLGLSESDRVTSSLVVMALDAAVMRHQALASNLANIHSENFRPQKLNFEAQLSALRHAVTTHSPISPGAVKQVRPFIESDNARPNGGMAGMMDMELVKLSQNAVHYQSLLKALDKWGGIVALAVNEGRR
jgi:flagellar basal-body rod protein FlgB